MFDLRNFEGFHLLNGDGNSAASKYCEEKRDEEEEEQYEEEQEEEPHEQEREDAQEELEKKQQDTPSLVLVTWFSFDAKIWDIDVSCVIGDRKVE